MQPSLTITIVDVDPDYLGIEIRASNDRFAGTARIYAGLTDLSECAGSIAGFPQSPANERRYEFGSPGPEYAGGYCSLHLRCTDSVGHARLELEFEGDDHLNEAGSANFGFSVLAADIDEFTMELRRLDQEQRGEAKLQHTV